MAAGAPRPTTPADSHVRWRDHAVERSLGSVRSRSEERVQRFLDAGFELLRRSGPGREFTVQEVVDLSGQSLRSFYQYFTGKHELLLALFDEAVRSATDRLEEQIAREGSALERLHRFVVAYFEICRPRPSGSSTGDHPTLVLADLNHQLLTTHPIEASKAFAPLADSLRNVLQELAGQHLLRDEIPRDAMVANIILGVMFNAAYGGSISGSTGGDSSEEAAENVWLFISGGVLAPS